MLVKEVSDPKSRQYRHYLTPEKFAEMCSPTQREYEGVIQFPKSKGLSVTRTYANRVLVDVNGAAEDIQKAFYVNLKNYRRPDGTVFYAPDREPSLDLDVSVLHVSGLDNYIVPHIPLKAWPLDNPELRTLPDQPKPSPTGGSGPNGSGFAGNDFRSAYVPGVNLTDSGQTLGLLEFDGYFPSDVSTYETMFQIPNIPGQCCWMASVASPAAATWKWRWISIWL
jgi:subtilase family serine protease